MISQSLQSPRLGQREVTLLSHFLSRTLKKAQSKKRPRMWVTTGNLVHVDFLSVGETKQCIETFWLDLHGYWGVGMSKTNHGLEPPADHGRLALKQTC